MERNTPSNARSARRDASSTVNGVIRPLRGRTLVRILSGVYECWASEPMRIDAPTALLAAGLRRAAESAGLAAAAAGERARVRVHTDDHHTDEDTVDGDSVVEAFAVDVEVAEDHVVVTMRCAPGPETWAALRSLVTQLVD